MIWRLAWRNLWRHRTRTFIVITAVVFTFALLLTFLGVQDDLEQSFDDTAVKTAGGHVFVHGENYWETLDIDRVIPQAEAVLARASEVPGVREVIPRIVVHGLAETADESVAVQVTGVVPEREAEVRDLREDLVEGSFPEVDDLEGIVLGVGVAQRLGVGLGDRVVVTAATADGEVGRALFRG